MLILSGCWWWTLEWFIAVLSPDAILKSITYQTSSTSWLLWNGTLLPCQLASFSTRYHSSITLDVINFFKTWNVAKMLNLWYHFVCVYFSLMVANDARVLLCWMRHWMHQFSFWWSESISWWLLELYTLVNGQLWISSDILWLYGSAVMVCCSMLWWTYFLLFTKYWRHRSFRMLSIRACCLKTCFVITTYASHIYCNGLLQ